MQKLERRQLWILIALFILVYGIFYLSVYPNEAFILDDNNSLNQPQLKQLAWASIKTIFSYGYHVDFYPLRDLSYAIDWSWGGDLMYNGLAVRVQNMLWFVLILFYTYRLLLTFAVPNQLALWGVGIWGLHPIHSELIFWMSSRKDLIGACGAIMATYYFVLALRSLQQNHHGFFKAIGLSTLALILSYGGKATFCFLPVGFIVIAWFHLRKQNFSEKSQRRQKNGLILFLSLQIILSAAFALAQKFLYSEVNNMSAPYSVAYRLQALLAAHGRYLTGLFWPAFQGIDMQNWGNWASFNSEFIGWGVLFFLSLSIYLFYLWKRHSEIGKPTLLMLILLIPTTPGWSGLHRSFYSVRYFWPWALTIFLSAVVLLSKKMKQRENTPAFNIKLCVIAFCLCIGLVAMNLFEASGWDTSYDVTAKPLALHPKNPSLLWMHLGDLYNIQRWGQLSLPQRQEIEDISKYLVEYCVRPGAASWDGLCHSFATECFHNRSLCRDRVLPPLTDLEKKTLSIRLQSTFARNFNDRQPVDEKEYRQAYEAALKLYQGRRLPTQSLRYSQIFAACLQGQPTNSRQIYADYKSRYLIDDLDFTVALTEIPVNIRAKLKSCLNGS